ncbi:adenosine deaminase [Qingshengfaniella alkalisoli]|uniref:Adenosine deaminase n=1 Tax=Qingshengfaniella alkalisoli TaxID=2599296 RepID=A0A5B8IVK8_9RHOB|nr:adenosine deaminase [Qingshengfaniella alkalisoli]QDY68538.1 adenosine deaminase [Qingshengfaniella alkalisoli]
MTDLNRIELHLHLEGAAPPSFIGGLAKEKKVDIARAFDVQGGYAFGDFAQFLKVYEVATSVLSTPEDYYRLTLAVLEEQAEQGILYTETFLAPDFCGKGDVSAWREYLAAMQEAADQAEAQFGTILRGIVTAVRHFGPDQAKDTALCAAETAGDWIVGFGLAGDERMGQKRDFAWSFDLAREAGLRLTAHAGEWGGPASVRDALDHLRVERIGHGVQAIDDPALVERLVEDGITLEVCPGSNVALGVYGAWNGHPIQKLRDAGVKVTVSTDDPPFFHTSMTDEYDHLAETFGWQDDDFRAINMTAAQSAFCDAVTRERLIKKLEPTDD